MSWDGDEIGHSLAARGVRIRRTPRAKMHDVRGLEELESRLKESEKVVPASIQFYDWEIVLDTSRFGKPSTKRERMNAFMTAPAYILGLARYHGGEAACVFSGTGGNFMHPKNYKDNNYWQPIRYDGPVAICKPVTLESELENGETVPFLIIGAAGIERKANASYQKVMTEATK